MKRETWLADQEVRSFLDWARLFVTGERALKHEWASLSPRWGAFGCQSLFEAYSKFDWPFSVRMPGELERRKGSSPDRNFAVLDSLSSLLRQAADQGSATEFLKVAIAVVDWGGVRRNRARLKKLGADALAVVLADAARLNPASADLSQLGEVSHLNSGFSKIHALLNDEFPIYDSRVACALASMVRRYCEENCRDAVPPQLAFSIPPSRGRFKRNPSAGALHFPNTRWGDAKQYANSNVIAAWLLADLAQCGQFGTLPSDRRLLALQSAMFMLGYRPMVGAACFGEPR